MARKSPRSRSKRKPRTLPGAVRARAAPGKRTRRRSANGRPAAGGASATPRRHAVTRGRSSKSRATKGAPARPARRPRRRPPDPARVRALLEILDRTYPDARCALEFRSPLELLIATILSAQCTDARVNKVTPELFTRYPDAAALAAASQADLEALVRSTGFFRNKARAIRECCADIVAKHGGVVPNTLEQLTQLRGVGRKTANVVLGNAYGVPGVVVDTHVTRLAHRLGLTPESDAVKIEFALMPIVPRERWTKFSHWLILHGRRTCVARKPHCSVCPLVPHCPRLGVEISD